MKLRGFLICVLCVEVTFIGYFLVQANKTNNFLPHYIQIVNSTGGEYVLSHPQHGRFLFWWDRAEQTWKETYVCPDGKTKEKQMLEKLKELPQTAYVDGNWLSFEVPSLKQGTDMAAYENMYCSPGESEELIPSKGHL